MKKTKCLAFVLAAVILFALAACSNNSGSKISETMVFTEEPRSTGDQAGGKTEPAEPNSDYIQNLVANMSLEEKVGQMFFAQVPYDNAAEVAQKYHLGGYVLFAKDIENKTSDDLKNDIKNIQDPQKIKMFIATDEEGGTVVRVSSNPELAPEPFKSPKELYKSGGMDAVIKTENDKADLLLSLGINVNFGPVCDITKDENAFMYDRSFSDDKDEVSKFVSTTVEIYKNKHLGSVLKHYPGYGNMGDTHRTVIEDTRDQQVLDTRDAMPFQAGIAAGTPMIMVAHTIVDAYDAKNPASLSKAVHNVLRNTLGFDGVIISDDLSMSAVTKFVPDPGKAAVQAIQAGNDMIIAGKPVAQYEALLDAVKSGTISEERINESVLRILEMKKAYGLIEEKK